MSSQDLVKSSTVNEEHKQHKKRTKKIKAQLKDQVEFYFGDANLSKDRFMKKEIDKHPEGYVAISTIASFNRMKQITDDIGLVVKAMKMSSMLEVSEDEAMVRRKAPVPEPRNVDAETIYVERLPPYADHDWVKEIFSKYGKVVYVSIPRFKYTGEIKGFAFVEFESEKEAQEALQVFNKAGGKNKQDFESGEKSENSLGIDQSNEQQKLPKGKRKRSLSESELDTQQKQQEVKRKRTISDSSDTEQHDSIKRKHEENKARGRKSKENDQKESPKAEDEKEKSKKSVRWEKAQQQKTVDKGEDKEEPSVVSGRKRSREDSVSNEVPIQQKRQRISDKSDQGSGEDDNAERSKKQRKRKRKKKEKKETRLPHLRVISKLEWLQLKKKYKNLQREAMNSLKKQLQQKSSANGKRNEEQTVKQSENVAAKGKDKKSKNPKQVDVEKLPYTPGVVLKFYCKGSGITRKELKDKFSSYFPVAYLDFAEGSDEGHVRFHTAENCASVFAALSSTSDQMKLQKLTEEAEKAYWEKINADRMARFNSKREIKRGTEKVARKAEALQLQRQSHIRFDESDGEQQT